MDSAYRGYQERMGGLRLPPMGLDYISEINNYPTWVVETENGVVAGLTMSFENDQASIANIAVSPTAQGQGIGGELLMFAEVKAVENGFAELHLTTHILLNENVSLYQHLGWTETSRDETRVYMQKQISTK
jgi:N-acetylglutamate synthase-like GNAT family acetyltransferase